MAIESLNKVNMVSHGSLGDFVLGESVEDGGGDDKFEDGGEEDREDSEDEAVDVFFVGEGDGAEGVSSELDAGKLDGEGEDEDDEEEGVVEEVLEDVDLSRLQLPCVDLVEHL